MNGSATSPVAPSHPIREGQICLQADNGPAAAERWAVFSELRVRAR